MMNRFLRAASILILSLGWATQGWAYNLTISHSQARDTFIEMLKDPALSADSSSAKSLVEMVRSYREESVPGTPVIQDGPFVGFVLQKEIVPGWKGLYESQYKTQRKKYVDDITYEGLFDLLMQATAAGQLPPELKKIGSQIGSCLAKKIESISKNSGTCPLDNSDTVPPKPSLPELAWMKYSCSIPLLSFVTSPCAARRAIFAVAKPQLIQAKKENLMAKVFPQIFPRIFRSQLLEGVNEKRKDIAKVVSLKFKTDVDADLWQKAPLIDIEDTHDRVTGLREFAAGLEADIRAASVLQASNPQIAAPLFYAAANRLLVLMGGAESRWDGSHFVSASGDRFDPNHPTAAPKFLADTFGGISITRSAKGVSMAPWDIKKYSPGAKKNPTPLQLFPSRFILGALATPTPLSTEKPYETLVDLGDLLNSLVDFLNLTSSQSALAPHFAPSTDFDRIVSAHDPAVFPREGRQLAVGMVAAIVQNMLAAGHLILPDPNAPAPTSQTLGPHDGLFGFKYYDVVTLDGKIESPVPTSAIANVFGAAARFSQLLSSGDPDIPQSLLAQKDTVEKAVEVSILSMLAQSWTDHGFVDWFGETPKVLNFQTQILALRALTRFYSATRMPAIRLSIKAAWNALDQFWSGVGVVPRTQINVNGPTPSFSTQIQSPHWLWAALSLWNQTRNSPLYEDAMKDSDWGASGWGKWQSRFEALQRRLEGQLESSEGPHPVSVENGY